MHSPNILLPVPSHRDPKRRYYNQTFPLMGFSQSHPQYLLTSAFTEVRNPSLPLIPGQCTMSCCQPLSDNKLLIFNWRNSMMHKTKQSQTHLVIGKDICFSLLLEGFNCSLDCILLCIFLAERHCTSPGVVLNFSVVQNVTRCIGISCIKQILTEI